MAIGSIGGGFGLGFDSDYTGGADFSSAFKSNVPMDDAPDVGGGGFSFGVGEALSLAQFGFSIGQMFLGDKVAEQQAYNDAYNTEYNNIIGKFRTEQRNKRTAEIFNAKLDYTKLQIENNYLAAQASWASEQMRLNDIYDRAAYKSESMRKMLAQTMGAKAAREVYGKSARRGAMLATLGAYGRSRAQLVDQLMSENEATQLRMKRTEQAFKARNKLTIAQTEVLPMMQFFTPKAQSMAMGRGIGETIGGVLGAGISAAQTGYEATPEGGEFFGFEKKAA